MEIAPEVSQKFFTARRLFGEPIIVTSGCRCKKHNQNVGGAENSYHLSGKALDMTCKNPTVFKLIKLAWCLGAAGFQRLGINEQKKFLHVDVGERQAVFKY